MGWRRYIFYSNPISRLARSQFLTVLFSPVAFYYLTLDIWGKDLPFISDNIGLHKKLFAFLIGISLLVSLLRSASIAYAHFAKLSEHDASQGLILLTSRVVREKLNRFKAEATGLKIKSDPFKIITQPDTQLHAIKSEIVSFMHNVFGVKEDEVCITIMHSDPKNGNWYYKLRSNGWNHTKADKLISENSMARICLERGEPCFFADKMAACKDGKYFASERDIRMKTGSAFCYPSVTVMPSYEEKYLISIITYGRMICDHRDSVQVENTKTILSEICKRMDLELTLASIKSWHLQPKSAPGVSVSTKGGSNDTTNQRTVNASSK